MNLYDIKLDNNKNVYLELLTIDIVTSYNNGRNEKCYNVKSVEREYPVDLKERIKYLKAIGFRSVISLFPRAFDVQCGNVIDMMMVNMLERKHILLDKVYDDKTVVEGMNVTTTYIHYINPETGVEYAKTIGARNDITSEDLQNSGYTPIENSILMPNINSLHNGHFAVELDVSSRNSVIQK